MEENTEKYSKEATHFIASYRIIKNSQCAKHQQTKISFVHICSSRSQMPQNSSYFLAKKVMCYKEIQINIFHRR